MWDIVWVSPQGHRSVSVSRHFLLQAPQCPWSLRKRFSRDHCCRGRSKPGCRIVGSHTRWELTTWADFQLCLHRLLCLPLTLIMSVGILAHVFIKNQAEKKPDDICSHLVIYLVILTHTPNITSATSTHNYSSLYDNCIAPRGKHKSKKSAAIIRIATNLSWTALSQLRWNHFLHHNSV